MLKLYIYIVFIIIYSMSVYVHIEFINTHMYTFMKNIKIYKYLCIISMNININKYM